MAPNNEAAYIEAKKSPKLVVRSAPYPSVKANQIIIKNHAVAINPIDWLIQERGDIMFGWLTYPWIMGNDVAGEVVEVGSGVSRFKVGDRVFGQAVGAKESINDAAQGGFQYYTVLLAHMTSKIPDLVTYESACVFPLGFSTASCGMFETDQLTLQLPTVPARKPTNKILLIWGGSTSVGVNAIQLAVAAGYEVFTTCSPRNFPLVKRLGASQVWDYNSPTVVSNIISAFKKEGKKSVGAISIGAGSASKCIDILSKVEGNKFVAQATYPVPQGPLPKNFGFLYLVSSFLLGSLILWFRSKVRGVKLGTIFGDTLVDNGVGKEVYGFLEKALQNGSFTPAPEPEIFGRGLDKFQAAMDRLKGGVSAKKVVVVL